MSAHKINHIAELAVEIGRMALESGSETHRVEEVMHDVCCGFGYSMNESYTTLTGMFLSIKSTTGEIVTLIKRIKNRNVDLDRISAITQLTNELKRRNSGKNTKQPTAEMTIGEFRQKLEAIKNKKQYPVWVKLICGGITPGFFCLLFGGSWLEFGVAFGMGIFVTVVMSLLIQIHLNTFLLNAAGAALIVWFAQMAQLHIGQMQVDNIIIGGIMLLVPGLAITNAIRDTMAGDLVAGTARAVEAMFIAAGIAAGAGSMLKLWALLV